MKRSLLLAGVSTCAFAVAQMGANTATAGGLPTNGKYSSGKGKISTSGSAMTIDQSSATGIINWKSFSVGAPNRITFDNGNGATLNIAKGASLSTIAGSIKATGSLYLMNAQGVIVTGTGKIVTGGTFIASSGSIQPDSKNSEIIDIANAKKKVANAGSITSSSGGVFLVGNTAQNTGVIAADKNDAVVAAASKMALLLKPEKIPAGLVEQQIEIQAGTGNATNTGTITGATAEVAAYGGEAEANAAKNAGAITALGAKNDLAAVWVISAKGKTVIGGSLKTAAGGAIETDGASVGITGKISAGKGGRWDWNAGSVTVNGTEGALINTALKADTDVSVNTYNSDLNLQGKNIVIDAPISWSTNAKFSVVSFGNIAFDKSINVTGAGTMAFQSVANGNYGEWHFANGASLNFGTKNNGASLQIQTVNYKLIYNVAQLQNINNNLGGSYALAQSIGASGASNWIPIGTDGNGNPIQTSTSNGSENGFFGNLDGLGHTVNKLSIDLPLANDVGLFGYTTTSAVRDVGMVGGTIIGKSNVGALIGDDDDFYPQPIEYVFSTSRVEGNGQAAGGLIGFAAGNTAIDNAYATGNVSGNTYVGGLIGENAAAVSNVYSTGAVHGMNQVGGLVGGFTGDGSVSFSYSAGSVGSSGTAGGLIGEFGDHAVTDSYWNTQTSGQMNSSGGTGLTTAQLEKALPAGLSSSTWGFVKNESMPYLLWQAPGSGVRPASAVILQASAKVAGDIFIAPLGQEGLGWKKWR